MGNGGDKFHMGRWARNWIQGKRQSGSAKIVLYVTVGAFVVWQWELLAGAAPPVMDIIAVLFLLFLVAFLSLFTKPLTECENWPRPPDEDRAGYGAYLKRCEEERQEFIRLKRYWMLLAYVFMVLALGAAVYPFTIDLRLDANEDGYAKQVNRTLDSPIGVFRGCSIDAEDVDQPLHCSGDASDPFGSAVERRLSWVLQIGGYVTPVAAGISVEEGDRKLQGGIAASKRDRDQAIAERERFRGVFDDLRHKLTNAAVDDRTGLQEEVTKAEAALVDQDAVVNQLFWLGRERERFIRGDSGFYVSGGLIIPFYLIVLSLVGGAVSLTRRIPEYQKQAAPGYVGTENAPALTLPMLREYLVFQIVQFISAPFIAAVAYYVLSPSTIPATVGLAFAAGFASETVLLWVRAMVNKLRPEGKPDTPTGSLAGTIPELKGKSARDAEKETTINIIGHANLTPVFSDDGQFAIDDVPEGARALEVVSSAGEPGTARVWCRRVNVEAGKTVPVLVEFGP